MKKKNVFILFVFLFFIGISAVFAETYDNINVDNLLSCGNGMMTDIPAFFPKIVSVVYIVIQIAVPVVLVITGTLDLFKGISAQKEDEIKKGQQTFIKRAIAAVIVFFVIQIVQIIVRFVSGSDQSVSGCFNCFINGSSGVGACESTITQ